MPNHQGFQWGSSVCARLLPFYPHSQLFPTFRSFRWRHSHFFSNGEFLQSEELTRKITFSATYTIFANHKFAGISIFTFFRVFSTIFVELHSKIFSPQKNLVKNYGEKNSKILVWPGFELAVPVPRAWRFNHCATGSLLIVKHEIKEYKSIFG